MIMHNNPRWAADENHLHQKSHSHIRVTFTYIHYVALKTVFLLFSSQVFVKQFQDLQGYLGFQDRVDYQVSQVTQQLFLCFALGVIAFSHF